MNLLKSKRTKNIVSVLLIISFAQLFIASTNFIRLGDESGYLFKGLNHIWNIDGLIYTIWYSLLSSFSPDPIILYKINFHLLTILDSLLFFLILKKDSKSFHLGVFALGCVFISSPSIWPYITRLHLLFILLLIYFFNPDKKKSYITSLILATLLLYIRPESFLSFVLIGLLGLAMLFRKKYTAQFILFYSAFFTALLSFVFYFSPLSSRSFFAFQQHFVLGVFHEVSDRFPEPWAYTKEIFYIYFDNNVHSITDAFMYNFNMCLQHILRNISLHLFSVVGIKNFYVISTIILIFIGVITYLCIKNIKSIKIGLTKHYPTILLVLIIILPNIGASIIIYPRLHYLLLILILLLFLFSKFIEGNVKLNITLVSISLLLGIFMYVKAPTDHEKGRPSVSALIESLDQVIDEQNIILPTMLASEPKLYFYSKSTPNQIDLKSIKNHDGIIEILQAKNINIIIDTPSFWKEYEYLTKANPLDTKKRLLTAGWKEQKINNTFSIWYL